MVNKSRSTAAPQAPHEVPFDGAQSAEDVTTVNTAWRRVVRRRSFLQAGVGLGVASTVLPGSMLLAPAAQAAAEQHHEQHHLNKGDTALLRLLAAVETVETDLWVQYNELGGNNGVANGAVSFPVAGKDAAYVGALGNLDSDMSQYISDNTDDELSHMLFLNAYLRSKGASPVDLSGPQFNTQPPSTVPGVPQHKRLTNLQNLTVDTSFYTRYRSAENPDFGATFAQAVNITNEPGIPRSSGDDAPNARIQAIANTASFHFGFIEQGGASLYSILALKASSLEVLRIIVSIGGVETDHFSLWHDKLGNAVSTPVAPVTDPVTGVMFPDLNAQGGELKQTNLILPEPCDFISESLPECSVIRPTSDALGGAVATFNAFKADGLFGTGAGFNGTLFDTLIELAEAADAASRQA